MDFNYSVAITVFMQVSIAQNTSDAEMDRLLKEASEEYKKAMSCDYLIKSLDEQLEGFKDDPNAYRQLKPEVDKQKEEIRKNCVNGVYDPDGQINKTEHIEEEEIEPELDERQKKLIDELKEMFKEEDIKVSETYDEEYSSFTRIPNSISFYMETNISTETFANWMKSKYGVNLEQQNPNSFQQTLNNIPLYGCTYQLLLRTDGSIKSAYGTLYHAKRANLGNKISLQQAVLKAQKNNSNIENSTDSSLIYVQKNYKTEDSTFYLCYSLFDYQYEYFVDVVNGTIIYKKLYKISCFEAHTEEIEQEPKPSKDDCTLFMGEPANNPEIVNTYYYGNQKIETHYEQKQIFQLKSNRTKNIVMVMDSLTKDKPGGQIVTSTNNKFLCYPLISGIKDVFISGEKSIEFYSTKLKRNSFDNKSSPLYIYFQPFQHDGTIHQNASWDTRIKYLSYGFINGKPLASIDIIGHEFTHGIIDSYCPSIKYFGETGAINEGIADIIGLAIEKFAGMPYGDYWKIVELQNLAKARNIANPINSGYPDTYNGKNYIELKSCIQSSEKKDNCGVHFNSTIISHWFYILSNGKKGINDLLNKYEVEGTLGYDEAVELVYESIKQLTPNINFEEYSKITIALAEAKFGKTSDKTCTVKNAWYAVGVLIDSPEKCVPGWTFTMVDQPTAKSIFYGKGDSIVILTIDKETGYHTKMYRHKESAYWKVVSETEDGITRMQIPNDIMNKYNNSKNYEKVMVLQNNLFEEAIRAGQKKLKDTDLTVEERNNTIQSIQETKRIYEYSKIEGQKVIDDAKAYEKEMETDGLLMTEKSFWGHTDSLKKFDKMFLKKKITIEGLKAKVYETKGVNWTSTTEIPYGMGDLIFLLPGVKGNKKLGVDHFMRGFPLIINGEKIASDIKQYVPGNFDLLFSDAAVF
jgi:Zn-dependent metalloprotease